MTTPPTPWRKPPALIWAVRVFLLAMGLFLVAVPFALLAWTDGRALIDDTRALLGAGVGAEDDASVPVASGVSCRRRASGSFRRTDRGVNLFFWECEVFLVPLALRDLPADDPFAGRTYENGMAEWNRRTSLQMDRVRARSRLGSVPRAMVTDRTTEIPAEFPEVRLLSAEDKAAGQPARYGVVWGFGEMLLRWLVWLLPVPLMMLGLGAVLLRIAWKPPVQAQDQAQDQAGQKRV